MNTRTSIIEILARQGYTSVPELSRSLHLTRTNIRHHLHILEELDLVSAIGKRRENRGRPIIIYGLSQRVLGANLDNLVSAMLDVWLGQMDKQGKQDCLQAMALSLIDGAGEKGIFPLYHRLSQLVQYLNQNHYKARWEARASGAMLILDHCPYFPIIEKHPEICILDAYLFHEFTKNPCSQLSKLEPLETGLTQCVFLFP